MIYDRCQSFGTLTDYVIEEWGYEINNYIVTSLNHLYDSALGSSSFFSLHFVDRIMKNVTDTFIIASSQKTLTNFKLVKEIIILEEQKKAFERIIQIKIKYLI